MACPSASALVRLIQSTEHARKSSLYLIRDQAMDAAGVAQEIRRHCAAGHYRRALAVYDQAVNNHGVLNIRSRAGEMTYYSDTGDPYGTTLLWTAGSSSIRIGDWGRIVEHGGFDGFNGVRKSSRLFSSFSFCGCSR